MYALLLSAAITSALPQAPMPPQAPTLPPCVTCGYDCQCVVCGCDDRCKDGSCRPSPVIETRVIPVQTMHHATVTAPTVLFQHSPSYAPAVTYPHPRTAYAPQPVQYQYRPVMPVYQTAPQPVYRPVQYQQQYFRPVSSVVQPMMQPVRTAVRAASC